MKSRVTTRINSERTPEDSPWSDDETGFSTTSDRDVEGVDATDDVSAASTRTDLATQEPSAQIMATIERNDDWMWQSDVVDAVDLSSSTVSRHLSSLEDQDEIKRIRIGREKVVGLPNAELDVFQSNAENARGE